LISNTAPSKPLPPPVRIDHMLYGVSDSGLGREGLRYAIEEMTEPKLLVMNLR
jgi:hypothetical protein